MININIEILKELPKSPGCYKFFDKYNNIIYVGKSKNIYKRVNSYFYKSSIENERLYELIKRIYNIEYQLVDSELDALILEYILIKKYKPWFNSQMKPDKIRPFLKISINEEYPSFSIVKEIEDDNSLYYSYFTDEDDIKNTLEIFSEIYKTPRCIKESFKNIKVPCLYFSLNKCKGPCVKKIDRNSYEILVEKIIKFLNREDISIINDMKNNMEYFSEKEEFEKANYYKNLYENLIRLNLRSKKLFEYPKDKDILVLIKSYNEKNISLFYVKNKKCINRINFKKSISKEKVLKFLNNKKIKIKEESLLIAKALTEIQGKKLFLNIDDYKDFNDISREIENFIK